MPEWIVDLSITAAALAAVIGASLGLRTYRELRPEAELQRRQNAYFVILTAEVTLMLTLLLTIRRNVRDQGSLDAFFVPAYSNAARRLARILDESASVDVAHEVVGSHRMRWDRHMAIRASLRDQEKLEDAVTTEQVSPDQLRPMQSAHLWLGLMDLAATCEACSKQKGRHNPLAADLRRVIDEVETNDGEMLARYRQFTGELWLS